MFQDPNLQLDMVTLRPVVAVFLYTMTKPGKLDGVSVICLNISSVSWHTGANNPTTTSDDGFLCPDKKRCAQTPGMQQITVSFISGERGGRMNHIKFPDFPSQPPLPRSRHSVTQEKVPVNVVHVSVSLRVMLSSHI